MYYVFAYGTLKAGYSNHKWIEDDVELVSSGKLPNYTMYYSDDRKSFPVLVHDTGSTVHGEIYRITDVRAIATMDMIENEGAMYSRILAPVHADNTVYTCYVYVGNEEFWDGYLYDEVPDGEF